MQNFGPGFSQMTPAIQIALTRGTHSTRSRGRSGGSGKRRRRKASKLARGAWRATRARKSGGGRRMKFGSPAWQKKYRVGRFAKKRRA